MRGGVYDLLTLINDAGLTLSGTARSREALVLGGILLGTAAGLTSSERDESRSESVEYDASIGQIPTPGSPNGMPGSSLAGSHWCSLAGHLRQGGEGADPDRSHRSSPGLAAQGTGATAGASGLVTPVTSNPPERKGPSHGDERGPRKGSGIEAISPGQRQRRIWRVTISPSSSSSRMVTVRQRPTLPVVRRSSSKRRCSM